MSKGFQGSTVMDALTQLLALRATLPDEHSGPVALLCLCG